MEEWSGGGMGECAEGTSLAEDMEGWRIGRFDRLSPGRLSGSAKISVEAKEKTVFLKKRLMIGKDKIAEIVYKIASGYNPEKIILFGSYATGYPNENSDLDLFVVKDSDLPRPQRAMQVRKILYGSMVPIDLIVYTPQEIDESKDNKFGFVYEVLSTGKILYERAS